jgi:hypothetical protein
MSEREIKAEEFLLGLVEQTDSDYHDGLDGYPNFKVRDGVLEVRFEGDGQWVKGRWRLEALSLDHEGDLDALLAEPEGLA